MKKTIRPAVICLLLVLAGALLFSSAAKKEKKTDGGTMTLMVYMIGSDLESGSAAASKDLEEMAAAGIDPARLNVLVCTGGAKKWHSDIPADENALLHLEGDGFTKVDTFPLESMGKPENLTRFLSYAAQNYPADRFGLILWDHGNGPLIGYGMDKQYGNDSKARGQIWLFACEMTVGLLYWQKERSD